MHHSGQSQPKKHIGSLCRPPCAELQPFIELLWTENRNQKETSAENRYEMVLPTGKTHIAVRLDGESITLLTSTSESLPSSLPHPIRESFGPAVIGGSRSKPYYKKALSSGSSFGMLIRPGAVELVTGVPANIFANTHLTLASIWGDSAAAEFNDRLVSINTPECRLQAAEQFLLRHFSIIRGIHPAVAHALFRFNSTLSVGDVVRETGFSHRFFNQIFIRGVGMSPKRYLRIKRFNAVLGAITRSPNWADIAADADFADQAHLSREFKTITGLTPGQYQKLSPSSAHHLVFKQTVGQ